MSDLFTSQSHNNNQAINKGALLVHLTTLTSIPRSPPHICNICIEIDRPERSVVVHLLAYTFAD